MQMKTTAQLKLSLDEAKGASVTIVPRSRDVRAHSASAANVAPERVPPGSSRQRAVGGGHRAGQDSHDCRGGASGSHGTQA